MKMLVGGLFGQSDTISLFDRLTRPAPGFVLIIHLLTRINCPPPYLTKMCSQAGGQNIHKIQVRFRSGG